MSTYVTSFVSGVVFGAAEGVAEGMTGAHINAKKKKSKSKRKKKRRSQQRHDDFIKKKRNAGLRPGDPKRNSAQLTELYRSIPSDVRLNPDDTKFWNFVDNREFGHQKPYKTSNDNSITNMIWQDKRSNRRLGSKDMDIDLKGLIKQQNDHLAHFGEDSRRLQNQIDIHFDSKKKKKRRKKRKEPNTKPKTQKKPSAKGIVMRNTAHVAVGAMGQAVGKSGGKVIGKQVAKVVGKKVAKKVGKKALKCIPFIGTLVSVGCAIATVAQDPSDGGNWILAVSDVGTSFLGPIGVVADVAVSSVVEYNRS